VPAGSAPGASTETASAVALAGAEPAGLDKRVEPGPAAGGEQAKPVADQDPVLARERHDIGHRIGELPLGQRPLRPIGKARGFVDRGAGEAAGQRLIARRIAEAADHCRDLGVEERRRHRPGKIVEDFDVLAGGVEDLEHAWIGHQLEERRELHPRRQRIDRHRLLRPAELDEAELRPIGLVAHELGVHGDEGRPGLAAAESGKCGGVGDQGHGADNALLSLLYTETAAARRPRARPGRRLTRAGIHVPFPAFLEPRLTDHR